MRAAKNPPSFILVDKSTGDVVYTKRATGVGSEAIRKCAERGRALSSRTGRTYFVYLDIMGARIGSKISVPMAYALGITEEVHPKLQREAPKYCPHCGASYIGTPQMHKFECPPQGGGQGMYKENPRGRVRKNIFTFNNPPSGPADTIAARELELYINNDSQLYHSQFIPIVKNLMLKRRRGVYDTNKAVTLFMYLMDAGAKKYVREFGTGGKIDSMFNRNTRLAAAKAFRHSFEVEADLGNYDRLISPVSNPMYRARFLTSDMKSHETRIRAHGLNSALKKAHARAERLPKEFTAPRSSVEVERDDVRKNIYAFNNPKSEGSAYIERSGGRYEVRFWSKDEQRYYSLGTRLTKGEAIALAERKGFRAVDLSKETRNNPRQRPHNEMERGAALVGLLVTTWAPGDGVTRYRFFKADGKNRYADYHQGGALYTANGRKEAISFIKSYGIGRSRMNPLTQSEHDRIRERDHHLIGRSQTASKVGNRYDEGYFSGMAHESRNIREKYRGHGVEYVPNPCSNPACANPKHGHVRRNPLLQTIGLMANPGSVKTFNETQDVGKAKYVVNYHDGVKVHRDGSPFFDIAIFSSRDKKDRFVRKLESLGFTRGAFRNPPVSDQWDRLSGRQRLMLLEFVGFEETAPRYLRLPWKMLSDMVKQALEQYWRDSSARGTTRRRVPVGARNPLTRREAGSVLREARRDIRYGSGFRSGDFTRTVSAGQAFGKSRVVHKYGPRSARRAAAKIAHRTHKMAGTIFSNPGSVRLPRPGTKMTVSAALELAQRIGDRGLIDQCRKALKLQKAANKDSKCVIWKTFAMGSKDKIDSVVALTHYGDSPETMYRPPKGSKKGNHMYRHTWGEKGGKRSVPLLASADGKMLLMPLEGRKVAGDWLRH